MRMDFMQRQRQWESEQARSAPLLPADPPEEDEDLDAPLSSSAMQISQPYASQYSMVEEEADEVAQREKEELEALLSYLPEEEEGLPDQSNAFADETNAHGGSQEHFGSDDDDYDALFSDLMHAEPLPSDGNQQHQQEQQDVNHPQNGDDEMDMS